VSSSNSVSRSPPRRSPTCFAGAAWVRRRGGSDPRGESSCEPKPSLSFLPVPLPPTLRIRLDTSRVLRPGPGRRQAGTRSSKDAAPMSLRALRTPLLTGGALGKSPSSQDCMGGRRSELCTDYRPAVRTLATDRSLLTFVWSPCPSTPCLLGAHPARPKAGWLPLSTLLSSADRPHWPAFRLRGVIRRSIPPPDRIVVPNTLSSLQRVGLVPAEGRATRPPACQGDLHLLPMAACVPS
jgi:hypothetical protein